MSDVLLLRRAKSTHAKHEVNPWCLLGIHPLSHFNKKERLPKSVLYIFIYLFTDDGQIYLWHDVPVGMAPDKFF